LHTGHESLARRDRAPTALTLPTGTLDVARNLPDGDLSLIAVMLSGWLAYVGLSPSSRVHEGDYALPFALTNGCAASPA